MNTNRFATRTTGTLFGIGVGPGDPDLITLRAIKRLKDADVVLAAASPRNENSIALSIAAPHLREGVEIVRLDFPMTRDKSVLEAAWGKNAVLAAEQLHQGKNAVFLTLGDPLVYSTFGYLLRTMRQSMPDMSVEIIPGITSFQAAAAVTATVLCEGDEALHILPGIMTEDDLRHNLEHNGNTVILKAYRNFPAIKACLEDAERADSCMFVSRLGLDNEVIRQGLCGVETPNYLSLVLAGKNRI